MWIALVNQWFVLCIDYMKLGRRQLITIMNELDSTCGISDEELTIRFKESIRICMEGDLNGRC